jgi:coenzyme F420-reducing hydrogenase alpha subunit
MKIKVEYIARVEGEGSVKFEIKNGKLKNLKLNIWEPPRFFEGFLVGRKYDEVPDIVSRICGICPVSHMTTSICAIERAMGIATSPEIRKIRHIMALSQIVASHLVHLYALALPDYHKLDMLYGLDKEIGRLVRLKEAVNNVTATFGGRALHPVSMVTGGFTKVPSRGEIGELIRRLEGVRNDALETVKMVSALTYPDLEQSVEYLSLFREDEYAVNDGTIASGSGMKIEMHDYYAHFQEKEVRYANAKKTILRDRAPIMVGALSRLHVKFDMLHPEAKKAAEMAGLRSPGNNPFLNIVAQGVEVVHGIWKCIELLDGVSSQGSLVAVKPREGSGAAMTEAPRGLLYHEYHINRMGIVEKANLVTPTAYNFLSLEENLKRLVNAHIDKPEEDIAFLCEMLVRAYDPCFSCSVH